MDITIGDCVAHLTKHQIGIVVDTYPQYLNGKELRDGTEGVIVDIQGLLEWWHKDNVVVI